MGTFCVLTFFLGLQEHTMDATLLIEKEPGGGSSGYMFLLDKEKLEPGLWLLFAAWDAVIR